MSRTSILRRVSAAMLPRPDSALTGRPSLWMLKSPLLGEASFGALAQNPAIKRFLSPSGQSWIGYQTAGPFVIALGGPTGALDELADLRTSFVRWASPRRVVWYGVGAQEGDCIADLGQEAIVRLSTFTLEGSAAARLRQAVNRASRGGLEVKVGSWKRLEPWVQADLDGMDNEWRRHNRVQLSFSLSRFAEATADSRCWIVVTSTYRVEAYQTWLPSRDGTGWVLDLMRRRPDAPQGAVELGLVSGIDLARQLGLWWVSLGVARGRADPVSRHLVSVIADLFSPSSLRDFKEKFHPDWQSRFVVSSGGWLSKRLALLAVAWVHLSPGQQVRSLLRRRKRS